MVGKLAILIGSDIQRDQSKMTAKEVLTVSNRSSRNEEAERIIPMIVMMITRKCRCTGR
jgi:hypothetical protein